MEAMLPVLKKADWRRKSEKREMRASDNVRARYSPAELGDVLAAGLGVEVYFCIWCSSSTQVTRVIQKAR